MRFTTVFTFILSGLIGNVALAAEAVPEDDISTLNGELVPVGDQNRFRYSHPRFNISANPITAIFGVYEVAGAMALTNNVALSSRIRFVDLEGDTGYDISASVPIYFRKVYSGVFLEPGVNVRNFGDNTPAGPEVLLGYHWIWDSGFNVSAAVGGGRDLGAGEFESDNFASGYLQFGYAF